MPTPAATAYAEFYRRSIEDREAFWAEQARLIDWQTAVRPGLDDSRPPFARWFVGGTTNLCHNAVDRQLATRGDQPALIYVSTETGSETRPTRFARAARRGAARWPRCCSRSASARATAC